MTDMAQIHDFAVKWCDKFCDQNINYMELVDHFMADDCDVLGFELDKVIDNVTDIKLLGSAIYSRWRYFNHWAYDGAEILEPNNHGAVVRVVNIEYFSEENVPIPVEKTKRIIRKCI